MKDIYIDTKKVKECGQDIMKLSMELGETIHTMFRRIQNMNNTTYEWVGASATAFIASSNIDKLQYLNMQDSIYKDGKYLVDYADSMECLISEVRE